MLSFDFTKFYTDDSGAACTFRYTNTLPEVNFDECISVFKQAISSGKYQEVELKVHFLNV